MYCTQCGATMNEDDNNCPSCGAPRGGSGGGQPPQQQQVHYAATHGEPVPTYLVPSILVTLFCCQIFGIVAIVFSAIAMGKNSSGDYEEAAKAAKNAKLWCWLGFGIGFAVIIIYLLLMVMGVAAGAAANP